VPRRRLQGSGDSQELTVLLISALAGAPLRVRADVDDASERARRFAVDLPGFGASERRDELLSPRAMGGFLAQLIAEADLGTPHIVAPDVGTSAALFAAEAHPERTASVTVGVRAGIDTIAGGMPDDIGADDLACYDGDRFVESMR
jgi:pimeloyl-ACP methyl ester carboxylesterase